MCTSRLNGVAALPVRLKRPVCVVYRQSSHLCDREVPVIDISGSWAKTSCLVTGACLGLAACGYAALNVVALFMPSTVAQLTSGLPMVAVKVARPLLSGSPSSGQIELVQHLITRSLENNALEPASLELLSRSLDKNNQQARAAALMNLAADLTPHYRPPHLWRLDYALAARDFETAASSMDLLFRTTPQIIEPILKAIDSAGIEPRFIRAFASKLRDNPPWRRVCLAWVSRYSNDVRSAILLFEAIRNVGGNVSIEELSPLLHRLVGLDRAMQAYALWIQSVYREDMVRIDHLYNGSFEKTALPSPFDWNVMLSTSSSVSYEPVGEGPQRMIIFDFLDGRHSEFSLKQSILLAPGRWSFSGKWRADSLTAQRGIGWTMTCRPGKQAVQLMPAFQGGSGTWEEFQYEFTVPDSGCEHQLLTLTGIAKAEADHDYQGQLALTGMRLARSGGAVRRPASGDGLPAVPVESGKAGPPVLPDSAITR